MVVFSYKTLREFADLYPLAADSLNTWYLVLTKGDFAHFHELREVFNSVDAVGNDLYVFNIKGESVSHHCQNSLQRPHGVHKICRNS